MRSVSFHILKGLVLIGVLASCFSVASAQAPNPEQEAAAREAREYVLSQVGDPLDVSGLNYCNESSIGLERSIPPGLMCGGIAEGSGSLDEWSSVRFSQGDIVKCFWPPIAGPSCVVTSADRTQQRFYSDTWLGGSQAIVADSSGNILGYSEQGLLEDAAQPLIDVANDAAAAAVRLVASLILEFATWILAIAGTLFNWVMVKAVFQFSSLVGNSPGLLIAWGILRDIGNMLLLFGFIFMGLATVLDIEKYSVRKALPGLILFAILMNFSLFAAEAVIDTSNGLSSVLYNQANADPCLSAGTVEAGSNTALSQEQCSVNYGIAGYIMQATGLSSAYGADDVTIEIPAMLGLALFATIGAVVLFAAAILLIIRAVILTFLMILAPIGFAGMAVPPLQKAAKDWWHALINQSFFAPILLLFIFLSLKITQGFSEVAGERNLAAAVTHPEASVMGIILVFALVIGFLVFSLVAARRFGAMGANFAIGSATKFSFGGVNLATSFTARSLRRELQRSSVGKTRAARAFTNNVLRPVERGALDLRRAPGVKQALTAAGAGEAATPKDTLRTADERVRAFRARVQAGRRTYDSEVERAQLERAVDRKKFDAENQRVLVGLSTSELEEMRDIKQGVKELVQNLSPEQFENLMKSEKLTDIEKGRVKSARYAQLSNETLQSAVPAGSTPQQAEDARISAAKSVLKNMNKADLENLPSSMLDGATPEGKTILVALSDKQRDDLSGSKKRTNEERARIRGASVTAQFEETYRTTGAAAAAPIVRTLTPPQIGKIDKKILTDQAIAQQLTPAMLIELQEQKKLNAAEIQTIAAHIAAGGQPASQRFIGPGGVGSAYWS